MRPINLPPGFRLYGIDLRGGPQYGKKYQKKTNPGCSTGVFALWLAPGVRIWSRLLTQAFVNGLQGLAAGAKLFFGQAV